MVIKYLITMVPYSFFKWFGKFHFFKRLIVSFLLLIVHELAFSASNSGGVNPVIGDKSYEVIMGMFPNSDVDESTRIRVHLMYVETILRSKDVSSYSDSQLLNRLKMLSLLHNYWVKAEFPKNYRIEENRSPCFIDQDNNICAVGYLIQQTAGNDIAVKINSQYQYSEIKEMSGELLENWISNSGLTKEECAMIQPTYKRQIKHKDHIILGYGPTYKMGDSFYHSFNFGFRKVTKWRNKTNYYGGMDVEMTLLGDDNFAVTVRGMRALGSRSFTPYLALGPEVFKLDYIYGWNIKPQMGIWLQKEIGNFFSFQIDFSYGYLFPLTSQVEYTMSRHNLSLSVGVGFKINEEEEYGISL